MAGDALSSPLDDNLSLSLSLSFSLNDPASDRAEWGAEDDDDDDDDDALLVVVKEGGIANERDCECALPCAGLCWKTQMHIVSIYPTTLRLRDQAQQNSPRHQAPQATASGS